MERNVRKSSVAAFSSELWEIKKVAEQLSSGQRSAGPMTLDVLSQLRASERRSAIDIIRRRYKDGELDRSWLSNFIEVLTKLKAEENQPEPV